MNNSSKALPSKPATTVEHVTHLSPADLNDLCDATDAAIEAGGGFGWVKLPAREILERYWQGFAAMPARALFVARLDGVICGVTQLIMPPKNNEAQSFAVTLTGNFVAPWARGHGLARLLLEAAEKKARADGYGIVNLDVRETQEAAIKLYESSGYIHFGTHPCYARVDGKTIAGHYYYKIIDPGAVEKSSPAP
jgi:ribosomal protein S18 acetylase RimI-like enzyme